jgi:redox-sensitive bicupin YhaK (pirin superfamily)
MLNPSRKAYVHLIRGELEVNGQTITTGDALLLEQESQIRITNANKAEVLVFDLVA